MPFKDKKKRRKYMRNYMRNYRKRERELIRLAKQYEELFKPFGFYPKKEKRKK